MTESDELPAEPAEPEIRESQIPRARHLIAIGGGRAGAGKTLLSVNLAVYLAQLGRNVVLCDADPFGSNLHTMLCLSRPPLVIERAAKKAAPVATSVPGLTIL